MTPPRRAVQSGTPPAQRSLDASESSGSRPSPSTPRRIRGRPAVDGGRLEGRLEGGLESEPEQLLQQEEMHHLQEVQQQEMQQIKQMQQQMEMMQQVVETTGDVVNLEKALNDNLQHLADTRQFEDVVVSLSAAIQLLSTRLGAPVVQPRAIDSSTENGITKGKAA